MGMVFNAGAFAMRNQLTAGMRVRASIRAAAKENGTLTKSGEETLNALDTFEREQLERAAQRQVDDHHDKEVRNRLAVFSSLTPARASTSRQAANMAGAFEAKAQGYAQQARAAAAMGDEKAAAELQNKSLEASQSANQMRAQEAQLSRQEAESRKAKLDREAKDRIEAKKAKKAAQEALQAIKQRRLEEARNKESAAKNHLEAARKAKRKRLQADAEAWNKRLAEGQFWIRQMQLAQRGEHPSQRLAAAHLDAYRNANISAPTVAPNFAPGAAHLPSGSATMIGSNPSGGAPTGAFGGGFGGTSTGTFTSAASFTPTVVAA